MKLKELLFKLKEKYSDTLVKKDYTNRTTEEVLEEAYDDISEIIRLCTKRNRY